MEENKAKEVKAKEVKMGNNSNKAANEQTGKLTYEQLNQACNQLFLQNQELQRKLEQQTLGNMFKRLDYLFKVVENANVFKDSDFLNSCIDEIKEALTIPEEKKESKKN